MKQLNLYYLGGGAGPSVPDGKTVTPTDDIQIWLNCANIWDKGYTTLAEVLVDTTTLFALIANNNAVDYMVRSTTWAVSISVPVMTSNTTPSGVASASSVYSSTYEAYKAFNGVDSGDSNRWASTNSVSNASVEYQFPNAVNVVKVDIKSATAVDLTIQIKGSNNGVTWENIDSPFVLSALSSVSRNISNSKKYTHYSCDCTRSTGNGITLYVLQFTFEGLCDNATAMSLIGLNNYCANTLLADSTWCEAICNSEYFESVLNVKVPAMTGYTTPEGVASAKSESGSYLAWKAFDRNDSTYWQCVDNSWPQWIQYKFVSSVKVYLASAWWGIRYPTQLKIQGSNDGSTWTDLTDTLSGGGTNRTDKYIVTSPSDYLYYRLNVIQGSAAQYNVYSNAIQFYGREDV